jgi:hypothetical protein
MPQFADTLTLPPAAGRTPGLTEIVHVPVVVPGCEHETLMLPLPSAVAVNVALVQEIEPAIVGTGTANPADATAAASTRLMVRFMYMVYLEKRWQRATSAQSKPWAIYGKEFMR